MPKPTLHSPGEWLRPRLSWHWWRWRPIELTESCRSFSKYSNKSECPAPSSGAMRAENGDLHKQFCNSAFIQLSTKKSTVDQRSGTGFGKGPSLRVLGYKRRKIDFKTHLANFCPNIWRWKTEVWWSSRWNCRSPIKTILCLWLRWTENP